MKQYALLAFLSPVASLLAVTGPAQSEKLKTKTNPQKAAKRHFYLCR